MLFSMQDYQVIWYVLIGLVLFLFAFTAGGDLGIGILLPSIGKTNMDRRVIINSIGPTWDGNQVWLIIAGGALLVIWPYAYALAFSGFYGAILLFLWALFLRPVGFEWRNKINKVGWQHFWDTCLFLGSLIPAFAIGLLIGNLMLGVPFHYDTSFRVAETDTVWQLFNPFSIMVGLTCICMLAMHGSRYLQLRTSGKVESRCSKATAIYGVLFLLLFIGLGVWIHGGLSGYHIVKAATVNDLTGGVVEKVPAALLRNYSLHGWMLLAPICACVFTVLCILISFMRRAAAVSYWSSTIAVFMTIFTFGFSQFPFVIPSSSVPNQSLTAWNASASHYTLQVIFIAAAIFLPTIGAYTLWVFKKIWGKVSPEDIEKDPQELY